MIGLLTGIVVADEADGEVLLDVNGVGYEVMTPLGTLGRARGTSTTERVTLYVHTHVREDALTLFGFSSRDEKDTFRTLIAVSNVGPKIALAILSALPADELARAIAGKDLSRLVAISGVGKKTAERLLLELKDKLRPAFSPARGASQVAASPAANTELLLGALTRMGYRPSEAERAIQAIGSRVNTEPLGDLIREALGLLAR